MSTHTPGPWTAIPDSGDDSKGNWFVIAPNEDMLTLGMSEADTRLIAAAPDLLAALHDALDLLSDGPGGPRRITAMEVIRAAIVKAEGTS